MFFITIKIGKNMINNIKYVPSTAYNGNRNNNNSKSICFKGNEIPQGDVLEIKGSQTSAKVFTKNIDYRTFGQVKEICSHPVFRDIPIRVMPDTHAGKVAVVGFTAPVSPKGEIIPSLINGDIGCGMLCVKFKPKTSDIDYDELDRVIRTYLASSKRQEPSVYGVHAKKIDKQVEALCKKYKISPQKAFETLGTLGGGNHFIEIDKDASGELNLVIHTGSRAFGGDVFDYYNQKAREQNPYKIKDLSYLSGDLAKEYLSDMSDAVKYSQLNRRIIADEILKRMGWDEISSFESVHNYIAPDGVIRKGAIAANEGQKVIIPLNMRDGAIIAIGKGNDDWNKSAPHGAGRLYSRGEAAMTIDIKDFVDTMKGIYTTCVSKSTIDEAPQAYKSAAEIIKNIANSVDIQSVIKPLFNFKG